MRIWTFALSSRYQPSCWPDGSDALWSIGSARHVVPSCDDAGRAGSPAGFGIMISIGAAKLVTGVPASAQRAVTSTICVPGEEAHAEHGRGRREVDVQDHEVRR